MVLCLQRGKGNLSQKRGRQVEQNRVEKRKGGQEVFINGGSGCGCVEPNWVLFDLVFLVLESQN
jgi:hypothetical protein